MTAGTDLRSWFLAHADRSDINGCWEWTNTHDRDGYARATYTISGRVYSAAGHRLAYELLVAPIPNGLVIDHLCRNRGCVNPGHMEIVTRGENVRRGERGHPVLKTHCKNGHEYTPENTYLAFYRGRRKRQCRACHRLSARRRRSRGTSTGSPTTLDVPRDCSAGPSVHAERAPSNHPVAGSRGMSNPTVAENRTRNAPFFDWSRDV